MNSQGRWTESVERELFLSRACGVAQGLPRHRLRLPLGTTTIRRETKPRMFPQLSKENDPARNVSRGSPPSPLLETPQRAYTSFAADSLHRAVRSFSSAYGLSSTSYRVRWAPARLSLVALWAIRATSSRSVTGFDGGQQDLRLALFCYHRQTCDAAPCTFVRTSAPTTRTRLSVGKNNQQEDYLLLQQQQQLL